MKFLYNNKKNIDVKDFYLYAIGLAVANVSFYASIYIIIIQHYIKDIYKISIILATFNIARVVSDIPFGILADRLGSVFIFILSKIFNLIAVSVVIFSKDYNSFLISMFFFGLAKSSFVGKAESYIFNFLNQKKELKLFSKIVPIYYGFLDIVSFISIFIINCIMRHFVNDEFSIKIILYVSMCSIFLSIFYVRNLENIVVFEKHDPKKSFFQELLDIFKKTLILIKKEKALKYFIMYFGFVKMVGWNIIELCILLLENTEKVDMRTMTSIKMILEISMSVGSFIAIIAAPRIKFIHSCFILLSVFLILSIFPFFGVEKIMPIIISTVSYLLIYCICEIVGERNIESLCSKGARNTVMSIATTFASLLGAISVLFFGKIAKLIGIHFSNLSFYSIPILYIIMLIFKHKNFEKNHNVR